MQLKRDESNDVNEAVENSGVAGVDAGQGAVNDGMTSNNEFYSQEKEFDPEKEFDFDPEAMFDTPKTSFNDVAGPAGQAGAGAGSNYYGTSDAGVNTPGAGTYADPNYHGNAPSADDPALHTRPRKLTKQEFFNSPRNRKDRDRIIISSIVVIVTAIFDLVRVQFWLQTFQKQIDMINELSEQFGMQDQIIDTSGIMTAQIITSVFLVLVGVGIWLLKSRACALAGLIFTIVNTLYTIVVSHNFRWYWTIIALGYAVVATFSFNKSWQDYEENGEWKRDW